MKRKVSILWLLLVFVFSGCDFGDTNVDPTGQPDVQVSVILPSAQAQTARNLASIGARVTGSVIQHFKGIEGQPESYSVYLIDENVLDAYWRTGLYSAAMRDCHIIIEKSEEENLPHYAGIAKVLMAFNLGIATTFWGDVPYDDAFNIENFKPAYDEQQQVYVKIQQLLDEAIIDLSMNTVQAPGSREDLIFSGETDAWLATARALKARYYLHLVKRDAEAASKAIEALGMGEEMTEESVPWFEYGSSQNEANTYAFFGEDRPNQLGLGNFLFQFMASLDDPRLSRYAVFENGDYLLYQRDNKDLFWTQFESPLPLISYTELLFIKAECYLRLGDLTSAETYFQEAIISNMELLDVSDYAQYLINVGNLSDLTLFEDRLRKIIEQKYVALFSQGTLESWVDFRRTGYPLLTPVSNANESFNPDKVIPKRYLYPISERNSNLENLAIAIERQGGHLMDQDLWAFRD